MKPETIYTVTVVRVNGLDDRVKRCWGWFRNRSDAVACVKTNDGDIFEEFYQYAVIEEMTEGSMADLLREWWYRAYFDTEDAFRPRVVRIKKPKALEYTILFSMG